MRKPLQLVALLLPSILASQTVRVRGVTFDSLSGRPIPVAFVTLGSRSTMADSIGRFEFDSVAPGTYRVTMQHDMLDTLGLGGIAASVVVSEGMAPIRLSTPSIMTMWRRVCPGQAPQDSGFVFGTVLDAATKTPVKGAPIIATWIDLLAQGGKSASAKQLSLESATIDDGSFVLCGVPLGTGVRLHSMRDSVEATSLDLVLTMASPIRRQDLALPDARGTARGFVRGTVVSAGKPVPNARVTLGMSPEARTGSNGRFVISNVPAGTQQIEVQGIGFKPVAKILNVAANDTLDVELDVQRVVTLDSVLVRGSAVRQQQRADFEDRRRRGVGYYRDSTQLEKYLSLDGAFAGMASVRTERIFGNAGLSVVIGGSRSRGIHQTSGCVAVVIVDRMRTDFNQLNSLRPQDIAALEVYRPNEMPMDLATQFGFNAFNRPCAVVAWTKAGWR